MDSLLKSSNHLIEASPEVKAYIYQLIQEFEPFVTPETIVAVTAKDPSKLATKLELEGIEISEQDLKKMHRISILLKEDGTKIEAEGLHEDIYEAVQIAKESLLKQLWAIHENVVNAQERNSAIQYYMANPQVH
ncbi:MAG: HPF/RaiA family ribosome-associated protein [Bdellovibrionia bacterium]